MRISVPNADPEGQLNGDPDLIQEGGGAGGTDREKGGRVDNLALGKNYV